MAYIFCAIKECDKIGLDIEKLMIEIKKPIICNDAFSFLSDMKIGNKVYDKRVRQLAEILSARRKMFFKIVDNINFKKIVPLYVVGNFKKCNDVSSFETFLRLTNSKTLITFLSYLFIEFKDVESVYFEVINDLKDEKEFLTNEEYETIIYKEIIFRLS